MLREGFPDRTRDYWWDGLQRLAAHAPPDELPKFGYVLAAGEELVGVLLLIGSRIADGEGSRSNVLQCNFSSWYVRPAYRAYASLLVARAVRNNAARTINVSPAAHTLATIEAQGFARVASGYFLGIPALGRVRPGARLRRIGDTVAASGIPAAEAALLADHARFGCLCFWLEAEADGEGQPFIFRRRVLRSLLPCAMLIHCPSLEALERWAGPLGRTLLGHGLPLLLASAARPLRGIPGRHFPAKMPIYVKGGPSPAGGDLRYTEIALFGL